jgi:hypothetical protein
MFFFSEEMVTRLGKARRGCQGVAGKFVFVGCDVFVFFFCQRDFYLGLAFCFVIDFFVDGDVRWKGILSILN